MVQLLIKCKKYYKSLYLSNQTQNFIYQQIIPIMKKFKHLLPVLIVLLFSACSVDDNPEPIIPEDEVPFVNGSTLTFATKEEGAALLGTSDGYTQALNIFDIGSRTRNPANVEEQNYLDFASSQAQDWTADEIASLKQVITGVKTKMEEMGLNLDFPNTVNLVKSAMLEEGGSVSYTREDYIVVKGSVEESFIVHELFHILSRNNPSNRDALFQTINFIKCNRIEYPTSIKDNVVTNPDAPFLDHYITVELDGEQKEAVFILYTEEDYTTGAFFDYFDQKLMLIEGGADSKTPVLVNNMPVLRDFHESSDLYEKIGDNTNYTLHPEEILADHFVALVTQKSVSSPSFIEAMKNVLSQ